MQTTLSSAADVTRLDVAPPASSMSATTLLGLSLLDADDQRARVQPLHNLRAALYDIGFLYVANHGVPRTIIDGLGAYLPALFGLVASTKTALSERNWPHFLGFSGFAEEETIAHDIEYPGGALVAALSYRFVDLVEEAFGITLGTLDDFARENGASPWHRIKLTKHLPTAGKEEGLEVLNADGERIAAPTLKRSFVVNFGNALEAATEGMMKATVLCVGSALRDESFSKLFNLNTGGSREIARQEQRALQISSAR
ncbi:hypothetical protein BDY21DRAFT_372441 [Lineolata rhizophorae]|uniref:Non-haem dioxygenase N-terminal domain-containing protein n=1 Tax=Lineolata rhizophorae TaxID=578093 RepID=A0A6A6NYG6_9PEZI|nr:hypothetical protein BDY21DRAFT_372441 [Lineolata rhizophorae]